MSGLRTSSSTNPASDSGQTPSQTPAPARSVTAADVVQTLAEIQRRLDLLAHEQIASLVKDRIDLRDALVACVDALKASRDYRGESMETHYSVREAVKVLRRAS